MDLAGLGADEVMRAAAIGQILLTNAIHPVLRLQLGRDGQCVFGEREPFRRTLRLTQSIITSAISRFFLSSIIMCVTPSMPISSSFRYSAFALPCFAARRALMAFTVSRHPVL